MNPPSRSVQFAVWGGLGVTFAVILLAYLLERSRPPRPAAAGTAEGSLGVFSRPDPLLRPLFRIPDFSLTNQHNQVVSLRHLRGRVWIVDIIFTRCAGPCPEMTRRMSALQQAVPTNQPVHFVSLTTDPAFDTPAVLRAYAGRFGAQAGRWDFLTGPRSQIKALAVDGLKLTALDKDASQQESPEDLFVHSVYFVMVDRVGVARAVFDSTDPDLKPKVLETLTRLLAEKVER